MKMRLSFLVVMVFTGLGLADGEGGSGGGSGGSGGGMPAEATKHMSCMQKRSDAMGDVTGFSAGSIDWPVKRLKFAKNNLKMMTSIVEEFLCHMKIELSDSLGTFPASVTRKMTPGGRGGTEKTIIMTLDKASSDSSLEGKGYDYVATLTVDSEQVAKIAWAGYDASTKGEASLSNLQKSMGVNDNAPRSEQMVLTWDTKGETSDEVLGTSKQVKALYNRQFGSGFMGDTTTGKGGMVDEAGYIEQTVASDGSYTLKAQRVAVNSGNKVVDSVIANILSDGTGTVATSSPNSFVATSNTGVKPSDMGLQISNVNMTTGKATSANAAKQTQFDGKYFQMPPQVAPKEIMKMGDSGQAFDSTSGNSKGKFSGSPASMMPPPPSN